MCSRINDAGRPAYARSIPSAPRTRGIAIDPTHRSAVRVRGHRRAPRRLRRGRADRRRRRPRRPRSPRRCPGRSRSRSRPRTWSARSACRCSCCCSWARRRRCSTRRSSRTSRSSRAGFTKRRRRSGRVRRGLRAASTGTPRRRTVRGQHLGRRGVPARRRDPVLVPDAGLPGQDWPLVFGVAIVSLVVATVADILPGDRYVRRRYQAHGTFRVALWTLVLAAATRARSAASRTSSPATCTASSARSCSPSRSRAIRRGRGWRRAARSGCSLLALVSWFARIPFEPDPGRPAHGAAAHREHGTRGHLRGRGRGPGVRPHPHQVPARPEDLRAGAGGAGRSCGAPASRCSRTCWCTRSRSPSRARTRRP